MLRKIFRWFNAKREGRRILAAANRYAAARRRRDAELAAGNWRNHLRLLGEDRREAAALLDLIVGAGR